MIMLKMRAMPAADASSARARQGRQMPGALPPSRDEAVLVGALSGWLGKVLAGRIRAPGSAVTPYAPLRIANRISASEIESSKREVLFDVDRSLRTSGGMTFLGHAAFGRGPVSCRK